MTVSAVPHEARQEGRDELVFLTTREVMEKIGISSSAMHRRRKSDPTFPKPVVLTPGDGRRRNIRWVKHEIDEWMKEQINNR